MNPITEQAQKFAKQHRVITITLKIEDQDQASIIWDAHARGEQLPGTGCKITRIASGDVVGAYDQLEMAKDVCAMPVPPEFEEVFQQHYKDILA